MCGIIIFADYSYNFCENFDMYQKVDILFLARYALSTIFYRFNIIFTVENVVLTLDECLGHFNAGTLRLLLGIVGNIKAVSIKRIVARRVSRRLAPRAPTTDSA